MRFQNVFFLIMAFAISGCDDISEKQAKALDDFMAIAPSREIGRGVGVCTDASTIFKAQGLSFDTRGCVDALLAQCRIKLIISPEMRACVDRSLANGGGVVREALIEAFRMANTEGLSTDSSDSSGGSSFPGPGPGSAPSLDISLETDDLT